MSSSRWYGYRHPDGRGLALVADVLPDRASVAKDLGVMNICVSASAGAILLVRQVR